MDAAARPGLSSSIAQLAQALRAARADLRGRSETMEDEPEHTPVTEEEELVAELDLLGIRNTQHATCFTLSPASEACYTIRH